MEPSAATTSSTTLPARTTTLPALPRPVQWIAFLVAAALPAILLAALLILLLASNYNILDWME